MLVKKQVEETMQYEKKAYQVINIANALTRCLQQVGNSVIFVWQESVADQVCKSHVDVLWSNVCE